MFDFNKPKIEIESSSEDNRYSRFIVEPLERGFGITLGNLPDYSLGVFVLPAGGFLTLGLLMALINYIGQKNKEKKDKEHEEKLKRAFEVAKAVEGEHGVPQETVKEGK